MIIANFRNDSSCAVAYSGLWQYSYGQTLRIQGLTLPTAVEIHFSLRETGGEAVTRVGVTRDGVTDVVIPDSMLENDGAVSDYRIYAFIYLTDETSGETIRKIIMPVKSRPKPEAFDAPEDAELFREAIAAVNEVVENAKKELIPVIGDNGNWFICGKDTGMPSRGESGVQCDYSQNDPNAPDYVKNRTHYETDPVQTVLIEEQIFDFTIHETTGSAKRIMVEYVPLAQGKTYTVVFDGSEYNVCAKHYDEFDGLLFLGNASCLRFEDTGEPFMLASNFETQESLLASYDENTSHTFKLSVMESEVVKIDAKFLPELPEATDDSKGIMSFGDVVKIYHFDYRANGPLLRKAVSELYNNRALIEWDGNLFIIGELNKDNSLTLIEATTPYIVRKYLPDSDDYYCSLVYDGIRQEAITGKLLVYENDKSGDGDYTVIQTSSGVLNFNRPISTESIILGSGSKKFKITVDDSGTLQTTKVDE